MKRFIRVLVPMLLVVALIGCAMWYLFVYDRDFTRDVLLKHARYFDQSGNPGVSEWFYNQAYAHADKDENVAIELANQYKNAGNYTKAEYTLSSAIADGGSVKLYTALCQTYVEQDKLLDAVNMLNNIADPALKQELDALRPKAPAATQEPGFYTQYISVDISAEQGTLYVSMDSQYPSVHEDQYAGSFDLPAGETTIYALSVGENGLVSPLSIFGYTIGGVIEPVTFADPAIEREVRTLLGLTGSETVYSDQVWAITEFTVPQDAQVYSDLSRMPYLKALSVESGVSGELKIIGSLSQLEKLEIISCDVGRDVLDVISAIPALTELTLADCGLASIEALSKAQNLTYLDLSYNTIGNINALSGMKDLQTLYMERNALTELSALSGLTSLTTLDVSFNAIVSIAPICTMQNLQVLDLGHNQLENLGAIDNMIGLKDLNVGYNLLADVSQLASCVGLERLDVSNNTLTDISMLSALKDMKYLDFSYNQITALPAFDKTSMLVSITGSYNQLSSLDALSGLQYLNNVIMEYNEEISSVKALAKCPNLIQVNVFGTKVRDVSSLTDQSIIVNYNPV
jgi:Leucine-rich repeat (LRR) protein